MIQLGSKPSTKQYPHDPQVTEYYSFKSLAMYGRLLFLYLVVLHLNSSTFLGLLLVFTFLLANEKKEFSLFKFLVAKLLGVSCTSKGGNGGYPSKLSTLSEPSKPSN